MYLTQNLIRSDNARLDKLDSARKGTVGGHRRCAAVVRHQRGRLFVGKAAVRLGAGAGCPPIQRQLGGVHGGRAIDAFCHTVFQVVHVGGIESITILHDQALGAGYIVGVRSAGRIQNAPGRMFALAILPGLFCETQGQITPIICPAYSSPVYTLRAGLSLRSQVSRRLHRICSIAFTSAYPVAGKAGISGVPGSVL